MGSPLRSAASRRSLASSARICRSSRGTLSWLMSMSALSMRQERAPVTLPTRKAGGDRPDYGQLRWIRWQTRRQRLPGRLPPPRLKSLLPGGATIASSVGHSTMSPVPVLRALGVHSSCSASTALAESSA